MRRSRGILLVIALLGLTAACGSQVSGGAGHGQHFATGSAPAQALRPGERFVTVGMAEPYTPKGPNGGTDDYRCFLIDPGLTGRQFLTGAQFLPENLRIVHHAIFFRMTAAQVKTAEALDAQSPEPGWTCFGDAGVSDAEWVAHWAPGTNETLLDPEYGYPLPAGTKLVMQVHYNTLAQQTPGSDKSGIRLRVSDQALTPLATDLFPAHVELPCTEKESGPLCDRQKAVEDIGRRFGETSMSQVEFLTELCGTPTPGPTQHCDFTVRGSAVIHAMTGHMHLLGRSIKVELNPGTSAARTLLDVPDYDFDDQALRLLPAPVTIERGDTIRVTCTHDAALRAQLPQLKNLPARYVVWGEGTSDEMCLGVAITSPPGT